MAEATMIPNFNPGTKPSVKMVGEDGNAFAIMGRCKRAARSCWTPQEWETFQQAMMSGDHDHLLQLVMAYFDVD